MGRFGFGYGGQMRTAMGFGAVAAQMAQIEAGAGWTGVAASGFSAPPADPARSTAKPALRLLVPPDQYFTDELVVGVFAAANDGGSLLDNLGLEKVRVYFEDDTPSDILAPSFHTFDDVNGNSVTYFGWWITLKKPAATAGAAHLYFEAVPKDAAMQNRVMGPYTFHPHAALYDHSVTVAAGGGGDYTTVKAAMDYLKTQSADNPLITITEAGTYALEGVGGGYYTCDGYLNITATAAVTFAVPSYTTDSAANFQTYWNNVRYFGSNITFDFADAVALARGGGSARQYWLDGVNVINSSGSYNLIRKIYSPVGYSVHGNGWFTECNIRHLKNACLGASLVRGCEIYEGSADILSNAHCAIDNNIHDWDSTAYQADTAALTVSYSGAAASATIEDAGNGGYGKFRLREDGVQVAEFLTYLTEAVYTANTNYTVQNVVDWINGIADWSATLLDDTIAGTYISTLNNLGRPFGAAQVVGGPITLYTAIDIHADTYQAQAALENIIVWGNASHDVISQAIFLPSMKDTIIANNVFDYGTVQNAIVDYSQGQSSISNPGSHLVIVHNSWTTQKFSLHSSLTLDAYCLVANNTMPGIAGTVSGIPAGVLTDNHVQTGGAIAAEAENTTQDGDFTDLFADRANGDFSPAGALLTNQKAPLVRYDRERAPRALLSPLGAEVA